MRAALLPQLCCRHYETKSELRIRQWGETARFYLSGGIRLEQGPRLRTILERCQKEVAYLKADRSKGALEILADALAAADLAADLYARYLALLERHRATGGRIYPAPSQWGRSSSSNLEVSSSMYMVLDWELRRGHCRDDELADADVAAADDELSRLG